MATLTEIREQIGALLKAQLEIAGEYEDGKEMPADVWEQVKARNTELTDLRTQFSAADERQQALNSAKHMDDVFNQPQSNGNGRTIVFPNGKGSADPVDGKVPPQPHELLLPMGSHFLSDARVKDWFGQIAPGGHVPEKRRIQSPVVEFGRVLEPSRGGSKALVTGASGTSAGALTTPMFAPLVELPQRPLTILDLVTRGTTGTDQVEYPQVTSYTNNAAPVAEATDVAGASGLKPQSDLALTRIITNVKTIAHWIAATKRALADAGQLRTLIDNFLMYGLGEELEDQIVAGNGTGESFLGILSTPGTTAQPYDTNLLTTARRARTKVRLTGRAVPNGYVLNPADWEAYDLLQDNEARYYFGGPAGMGQPVLWGLPVIESEAMPVGTGLCADLRQVVVWDREQAALQVSDQHADFFTRNLVAILAEMRAAMGILRPAAVVVIDLTP